LHRCTLVPADEYLFGFLLLISTLYFQLGSGSGLDVIKYPARSNTFPLAASATDAIKITNKNQQNGYKLEDKINQTIYRSKRL
jgi:hypothetical protein